MTKPFKVELPIEIELPTEADIKSVIESAQKFMESDVYKPATADEPTVIAADERTHAKNNYFSYSYKVASADSSRIKEMSCPMCARRVSYSIEKDVIECPQCHEIFAPDRAPSPRKTLPRFRAREVPNKVAKTNCPSCGEEVKFSAFINSISCLACDYEFLNPLKTTPAPVNQKSGPVLNHKCVVCGYAVSYSGSGSLEGVKCPKCGAAADKEINTIIDRLAEGESPTGKMQYRWFCKACNTKGISWYSRSESSSKMVCVSCGADRKSMNVTKLPPSGSCDDVWGLWTPESKAPSPTRKKWMCPDCGYVMFYLVKKPESCHNCPWHD